MEHLTDTCAVRIKIRIIKLKERTKYLVKGERCVVELNETFTRARCFKGIRFKLWFKLS